MNLKFLNNIFIDVLPELIRYLKELKIILLSIVIFGSTVRMGINYARDIDILIIIDKTLNPNDNVKLVNSLRRIFRKVVSKPLDIIVMSYDDFKKNLIPNTILGTFVLGYKVIYDVINFDKHIIKLFKELAKGNYIYGDKFSVWNLSKIAKSRLSRLEIVNT